jgi:hypothetical protein
MTASAVSAGTVAPAAPIAIPTSASARAGASLTPSPTITTLRKLLILADAPHDLELLLRGEPAGRTGADTPNASVLYDEFEILELDHRGPVKVLVDDYVLGHDSKLFHRCEPIISLRLVSDSRQPDRRVTRTLFM